MSHYRQDSGRDVKKIWISAVILKIIPCVLLTIFMALLVWMLMEARERRARICGGATTGNSQAERTTAMLTCIVAVFLITELPQGIITSIMGKNGSRLCDFT